MLNKNLQTISRLPTKEVERKKFTYFFYGLCFLGYYTLPQTILTRIAFICEFGLSKVIIKISILKSYTLIKVTACYQKYVNKSYSFKKLLFSFYHNDFI